MALTTLMKYLLVILVTCCFIDFSHSQSCEIEGVYHSTFQDIKAILDSNNCSSCHGGNNRQGGWNYSSYQSLLENGDCGQKMILHGDASNSYFYNKLSGGDGCGLPGDLDHIITSEEINQIESWINFGAPEHCVLLYSDIQARLDQAGCNSCHNQQPEAWRYDSYGAMLDGDWDNSCNEHAVIVKGDSKNSQLFDKINNDGYVACGDEMNASSGPMSAEDIASIRDWINSGANETAASLPVILNYFSVAKEEEKVLLKWSTEVEIATDRFVVERSQTGKDFEAIAELSAEGSSSIGRMYVFEDQHPIIGDNFYRLKIIDLDGSFNYSNIRRMRVKSGETIVTVYPNPAVSRERITVKWLPRANEESTYLNIVDMNGQNLHRKIIFEGTNYVRLPYLLDGVYYIIIEDLFGGFLLERVVIIN